MKINNIALSDYSTLNVGDSVFQVTYDRGRFDGGCEVEVVKKSKTRITVTTPSGRTRTFLMEPKKDTPFGTTDNAAVEYGAKYESRGSIYLVPFGDDLDEFTEHMQNITHAKALRKELADEVDDLDSGYGPTPGRDSEGAIERLNQTVAELTAIEAKIAEYQNREP